MLSRLLLVALLFVSSNITAEPGNQAGIEIPLEHIERFQEIANRGIQDRLAPDRRAQFDEAVEHGLVLLPSAQPTYLCIPDESLGFYYKNDEWVAASFKVTEDKYILRRLTAEDWGFKDKSMPYGVFMLGQNTAAIHRCRVFEDAFQCRTGIGQFYFSSESGRYIKTYTAGYWNGKDNNENTPHIERGRCSKI